MSTALRWLRSIARWWFVPERPEHTYPGAEFSYELARDSYDLMLRRYEFAHQRVEYLATIAISVGIGVPALVAERNSTISFSSPFLILAGLCVGVAILIVVAVRIWGGFVLVSPETLYQKWMHLNADDFRVQYTFWAGEHFKQNAKATYWKSMAGIAIAALILVESLLLALWLITER